MKKKIKIVLLALLLVFNISGVILYAGEGFSPHIVIEEKQVTIIDKYTIGRADSSHESSYMKGQDAEGNIHIITGPLKLQNRTHIGDKISIYQNPDSANAQGGDPQWKLSPGLVRRNSIMGFFLFVILTAGNVALLVYVIRKDRRKEEA